MVDTYRKIVIDSPVDLIVSQIRELISSGKVKPGQKLPPERKLAIQLGVSRNHLREAINRLQIYGIVKVQPQSGTIVTGVGITAMEGFITDVLKFEKRDFSSLVETRHILEVNSASLAAERRTEKDIQAIEKALSEYERIVQLGESAVEADLQFHLAIVESSKNPVLRTLMQIISPDIVSSFMELNVCEDNDLNVTVSEHKEILHHIIHRDAKAASRSMKKHLHEVVEFSKHIDLNNLH